MIKTARLTWLLCAVCCVGCGGAPPEEAGQSAEPWWLRPVEGTAQAQMTSGPGYLCCAVEDPQFLRTSDAPTNAGPVACIWDTCNQISTMAHPLIVTMQSDTHLGQARVWAQAAGNGWQTVIQPSWARPQDTVEPGLALGEPTPGPGFAFGVSVFVETSTDFVQLADQTTVQIPADLGWTQSLYEICDGKGGHCTAVSNVPAAPLAPNPRLLWTVAGLFPTQTIVPPATPAAPVLAVLGLGAGILVLGAVLAKRR